MVETKIIKAFSNEMTELLNNKLLENNHIILDIHYKFCTSYFIEIDTDMNVVIYDTLRHKTYDRKYDNLQVWVGQGYHCNPESNNMEYVGNSVLICENSTCKLIASDSIIQFSLLPGEIVTKFYSTTCANDISYGFVQTNMRIIVPNIIGSCEKSLGIYIKDVEYYNLTPSYITSIEPTFYTHDVHQESFDLLEDSLILSS
jgi:hypothetical protein